MDAETFLVKRERLEARLVHRRQSAEALVATSQQDSGWLGKMMPFWLRFAATTLLPARFSGFWPRALLTVAPMVFGLAKTVTGQVRRNPSSVSAILGFFPIVKSLIKRYN